jgi:hypothetical protein
MQVDLVINYDLCDANEYIHRIAKGAKRSDILRTKGEVDLRALLRLSGVSINKFIILCTCLSNDVLPLVLEKKIKKLVVAAEEEKEEKEAAASELKTKLVAGLGLAEKSGRLQEFDACLGTVEDSMQGCVVCNRCNERTGHISNREEAISFLS